MKIMIPRLPAEATREELAHLASGLLAKRFHLPFAERPALAASRVVRTRDGEGVVEHHGILEVTPDRAARWLIKRLAGQQVHGKRILAREFVDRGPDDPGFEGENDRRRPSLKVDTLMSTEIKTEGVEQFNRTHGE